MDKIQKFDYMESIEDKLQRLEVFELFEDMLKQIMVTRPEKPLDFILQNLAKPPMKRVFFLGPPGCCRKENSGSLAEYFQWKHISTGDTLRKIANETKHKDSKKIADALTNFKYVEDDIVIEAVQKEIQDAEKQNQSWILEGFPRTRVQALSLQKMNIIPDKFVYLSVNQKTSVSRIRNNINEINKDICGQELENAAQTLYREWEVNQLEVNATFNQFIYKYDCDDKVQQDVANDLARMLRVRFRNGAPRRPPKVMLVGPPGSGRTSQCEIIAQRFGLVAVSPEKLVRDEQESNPAVKIRVQQALEKGEDIPDEVILRLIDARLKQSDCVVNGWVLDGFPQTDAQIQLLRASKIRPSLVCLMDQDCEETMRRLSNRRIDPLTGHFFNLEINQAKNQEQAARLEPLDNDRESLVQARFAFWKDDMCGKIEEEFKARLLTVTADRLLDQVSDQIADAVQNPVF